MKAQNNNLERCEPLCSSLRYLIIASDDGCNVNFTVRGIKQLAKFVMSDISLSCHNWEEFGGESAALGFLNEHQPSLRNLGGAQGCAEN